MAFVSPETRPDTSLKVVLAFIRQGTKVTKIKVELAYVRLETNVKVVFTFVRPETDQ